MTDVSKMTLKILYSLDNGSSGTYLARSKKPKQVRVATLPNFGSPNDGDSTSVKIGAVELSLVLQEIYLNSPELLNHNVLKNGHDYNLYYKDICEVDEPLVSLGLLSQIRLKVEKQTGREMYQDEENDDEETFIVTGRVCSNFAALLKRSYSISGKAGTTNETINSSDTLEVKLRFIRVLTAKSSRRSSTNASSLPRIPIGTQTQQNTKTSYPIPSSKIIRPVKTTVTKRQMNPTPAPKAERTQSLPIWNPKQASNSAGFPTNSIAHKIYLADRKTEAVHQGQTPQQQHLAYQINALQQDNTVQKFKVDDSVSKRFDFMLNKKKKQQQYQQQGKVQSVSKKPAAAVKARRFNTMASIPMPLGEKPTPTRINGKQKQRLGSVAGDYSDQEENCMFHELLANVPNKQQDDQESMEDNKENHPPQVSLSDTMDLELLSFPDMALKGETEWFGDFNPFNSPSMMQDILTEQALKPASTTPKDPNTCNTEAIENGEEEDHTSGVLDNQAKLATTSDIDRTSPIDTLSMPLLELNECSNSRMVSCQEQLRRLPLLGHHRKGNNINNEHVSTDVNEEEDKVDDDVTSIVMHFSSSSQDIQLSSKKIQSIERNSLSENSSPMIHRRDINDEDEEEEEMKESLKKQRIMPSSPTTMFNYQDDLSSAGDTNDLFSSFINGQRTTNQDADSTPATQYQNQSSDRLKD